MHRAALLARDPALEKLAFEDTRGGLLGMTLNQAQIWGEVGANVFATAGYNGTGVAKGTGSGIALAEKIADEPLDLVSAMTTTVPPSWVPPRPFIGSGVWAMTSFLQRRAGRERSLGDVLARYGERACSCRFQSKKTTTPRSRVIAPQRLS